MAVLPVETPHEQHMPPGDGQEFRLGDARGLPAGQAAVCTSSQAGASHSSLLDRGNFAMVSRPDASVIAAFGSRAAE